MNSIITDHYPVFEMYQSLRMQLLTILGDDDLGFSPGGDNLTLGQLCLEIGEVQQSYIDSFRTFTQDFSYRHDDPTIAGSVEGLSAWYQALDAELKAAVSALSEDDIQNREIERGFAVKPFIQLEVYKEALLIFYGKVTVYLRAMGLEPTEQWREWIV